ncbi:hydroxymethylglutaryl-CoA reductase, degradative [Dactylosporangium sp. CA-092794]|uniref:hydroxymethylglutaryl-CoA reductase, degradative n=1 Tax=Dactylosporangium sp. CA-092794 TaxID=3239929 RepID=UPI003D8E598F
MAATSRVPGFKDRTVEERRRIVTEHTRIPRGDLAALDPAAGLSLAQADHMIENVVGTIGIPVGVATNFTVNGRDRLVPMATEEPSVVAAASNAARMARDHGGFRTSSTGSVMIAQIQLVDVVDPYAARARILESTAEIAALADAQDPMLRSLGGGVRGVDARVVDTRAGRHVIVHLTVDVRDAMGANAVNTMAEAVAPRLAELGAGRALLRILSNKADLRLTRARAVFDAQQLGGPAVVDGIVQASALAEADPYRAATHNKGIMNGVTAVVLATGNDTRAVEAGCHSHAVQNGRYSALSRFEKDATGNLVGTLELPLAVGLVGGATRAHPAARVAIAILGVATATELADVIASVGLAQNLAACRALAAEGIQRGHMSLHARTIAASAGAGPDEIAAVAARLVADRQIRAEHAERVLRGLRGEGDPAAPAAGTALS